MNKWEPTMSPLILRRMGKTIEEAGELLDVCGRVIIQGIDEIDPGTDLTNRQRLENEIADVYAQLDETVLMLELKVSAISRRRAHKRGLMGEWEALLNE